ncbi:hypothetical protein ELY15_08260 [Legionella sp. km772]|nr:hypothetical protein ELY15_08260 [Legionella sp. km772]
MARFIGTALLFCTSATALAADIECKGYNNEPMIVKPKSLTIFNNSDTTIYPVISTSKNAVNEWLQGCFRTTATYPTNDVYKLYVNEGVGIAPGSSVSITLPLYSKLSDLRYITWWNGGRVVLADRDDRLRNEQDVSLPTPSDLSCEGQNTSCTLTTYSSDVQFPENIYAQLSEYTFGDSIIPVGQSTRLLKPDNVGYNISYVDHVYMPVAIEPKNNPYIGYSGSTMPLSTFREHLLAFLTTPLGQGWPVYNLSELKLPGGYNIFAQRSGTLPPNDQVPVKPKDGYPPVLTVLSCIQGNCNEEQKKSLHYGEAVQRMQNLWGSCVKWDEDVSKYVSKPVACPADLKQKLGVIQAFFKQNHQQYLQLYKEGRCNLNPNSQPVPFSYWQVINHVYGWVPFNEGCGASANPLAETKIPGWDHAKVQAMYTNELQYNYKTEVKPELLFNPYVQLIHDKNYLSLDAYGFSVDDAVGFMSELGDGLVFTVGGTRGLENPQAFNYADGFSVAIGVPQSQINEQNKPLIKKYGVCVFNQDPNDPNCLKNKQDVIMPANSQIAGFRVGTVASYPIKVRFTDLNDNQYSFEVNSKFAACPSNMDPSQCPTNKAEILNKESCEVLTSNGTKHPKSNQWCQSANPNQQKDQQLTKNFISFAQPVDFLN